MNQVPKYFIVVAILAVGILLSRPYQKENSATSAPPIEPQVDDSLVLKDAEEPVQVSEFENIEPSHPIETIDAHVAMLGSPVPFEGPIGESASTQVERSFEERSLARETNRQPDHQPSQLPLIGETISTDSQLPPIPEIGLEQTPPPGKTARQLNPTTETDAHPLTRDRQNRRTVRTARKSLPAGAKRKPQSLPKTHRIVDGDDLRDLAARYMGNQTRFMEIYEANKDVLVSPEILPIGREIKIFVD